MSIYPERLTKEKFIQILYIPVLVLDTGHTQPTPGIYNKFRLDLERCVRHE